MGRPGEDANYWMPTMYGPIIATGGTLNYDGADVVYEFRDASSDDIESCVKCIRE